MQTNKKKRGVDRDLWVSEGLVGEIVRTLTLDLCNGAEEDDEELVSIALPVMKERAREDAQ